jgi:hypothetical protein
LAQGYLSKARKLLLDPFNFKIFNFGVSKPNHILKLAVAPKTARDVLAQRKKCG